MVASRTYAILDVSCECYQEIRDRLDEAGPEHVWWRFVGDEAGEVIDMNGLVLSELEPTLPETQRLTPGTPTELKLSCSCSCPEVRLEPPTEIVSKADLGTPTVELLCHYCGSAIMIVRHDAKPDEYFRKTGHEPETGGR